MLILTLRTDKPEAEIGLYKDEQELGNVSWQAHRQLAETIHQKVKELLTAHKKEWSDLEGVIVYRGPGSFTGLRIGLSVANTLAKSLEIAITGQGGPDWRQSGIKALLSGHNDQLVMPEYGADVYTTQPKK